MNAFFILQLSLQINCVDDDDVIEIPQGEDVENYQQINGVSNVEPDVPPPAHPAVPQVPVQVPQDELAHVDPPSPYHPVMHAVPNALPMPNVHNEAEILFDEVFGHPLAVDADQPDQHVNAAHVPFDDSDHWFWSDDEADPLILDVPAQLATQDLIHSETFDIGDSQTI